MFKDITGQRFERLVVIERTKNNKTNNAMWLCNCDCGKTTIVAGIYLRSGHVRSCGCLMIDACIKRSTKHGYDKKGERNRTYTSWAQMIQRCENTQQKNYAIYGGRGVTVCEEWHDFKNFLNDMGEAPLNKSLDRINSNGSYNKDNCRWATQKEQCNNKRNNVLLTYNGKTQNITQWADEININRTIIGDRIRRGWDVQNALTKPVRGSV